MGGVTQHLLAATLQAARALRLGLNMDEAKSWGLNRALFYATAKRGWENAKAFGVKRPYIAEYEQSKKSHEPAYSLGGERAFRSRSLKTGLRFRLADRTQQPREFDAMVIARIPDWEWNSRGRGEQAA